MDKMIKLSWNKRYLYVWFKDDTVKIRYFVNKSDFTNLIGSSTDIFLNAINELGFNSYKSDRRKEKVIMVLCYTIRNKLDDPRNENADIIKTVIEDKNSKKLRKDEILWR
jgi:hypothetical protein